MQKSNNKGVLKRIKWENIITILMIIFDLYAIYTHIQLNGFYNELGFEFIIYFGMTFGLRYMIKDIRKNFKEYISIFFEN
jgi:hypothetical protein